MMLNDNADKFDLEAEAKNSPSLVGAPPKPINIDDFKKLCLLQCTEDEIAGFFGVSTRTIKRRLKEDVYREAWDAGRSSGKISLRRRMWASSAGTASSAVTMQIHLSRHWLGMTDKAAIELSGRVDGKLEVSSARERLAKQFDDLATKRQQGAVAGIAAAAGAKLVPEPTQ